MGMHTLVEQTPFILVLAFGFKVAAQDVALMVEYPPNAAVCAPDFLPDPEVAGSSFEGKNAECVSLAKEEHQGHGVEFDNTPQGFRDTTQERILGQTGDKGIIDLQQNSIVLCFSLIPDWHRMRHGGRCALFA